MCKILSKYNLQQFLDTKPNSLQGVMYLQANTKSATLWVVTKTKDQKTNKNKKSRRMTKMRKRQEDRVLKRLSGYERRKQLRLRQQIMSDSYFLLSS